MNAQEQKVVNEIIKRAQSEHFKILMELGAIYCDEYAKNDDIDKDRRFSDLMSYIMNNGFKPYRLIEKHKDLLVKENVLVIPNIYY